MLSFLGRRQTFCDGVSRRSFLTIGGLAFGGMMGGFSLPQLLRAESLAGPKATKKSIINIYLPGGPSHMDMFDLKPEAPKEYRGEFKPIATSSPGMEICEHFPKLAALGDKFSVIRSIYGIRDEHAPSQSDSGWSESDLRNIGGRPGVGAVMSKVYGASQTTSHGAAPTSVDLTGWTKPGYLGQSFAAYRPDGPGRENLILNSSVTIGRLDDRKALLGGLDRIRRQVDGSGMMSAMDAFSGRAVDLITSGALARALDLRNEDPRNQKRYYNEQYEENARFLTARRLIQSGVRCVSFSWGGWDTHGNNFGHLKMQLPSLDRALSALIEDLDAHGILDDTIIMMSGEFGRTPRVNAGAGRDHWAPASSFFLAGGGFRHGQAIGTTNRLGEVPKDRPVHIQNVFHTVYRQLGIDTDAVHLVDPNGRPQYVVDQRQLVRELV